MDDSRWTPQKLKRDFYEVDEDDFSTPCINKLIAQTFLDNLKQFFSIDVKPKNAISY